MERVDLDPGARLCINKGKGTYFNDPDVLCFTQSRRLEIVDANDLVR